MLRLPFEEAPSLLSITTERERNLYQAHFELLQDWNTRMALVSRKSIEKSFESHYADSILISDFAKRFYTSGTTHDLGSGAGFPGVLFGIRYPDLPVVLFERVQKKQKFLKACIESLGLKNVELRGEWRNEKCTGLFLARAVTPREELFQFFEARVSPGSVVIMNSGGAADISSGSKAFMLLVQEKYSLPKDAGDRHIEAFQKVSRGTY